jgi:hypothetical protein
MALVRQPTIRTMFLVPVLVGVMASVVPVTKGMTVQFAMEYAGLATLVWCLPGLVAVKVESVRSVALLCFLVYECAAIVVLPLPQGLLHYCLLPVLWPVLGIMVRLCPQQNASLLGFVILALSGGVLYSLVGVAFAWSGRLKESKA